MNIVVAAHVHAQEARTSLDEWGRNDIGLFRKTWCQACSERADALGVVLAKESLTLQRRWRPTNRDFGDDFYSRFPLLYTRSESGEPLRQRGIECPSGWRRIVHRCGSPGRLRPETVTGLAVLCETCLLSPDESSQP